MPDEEVPAEPAPEPTPAPPCCCEADAPGAPSGCRACPTHGFVYVAPDDAEAQAKHGPR